MEKLNNNVTYKIVGIRLEKIDGWSEFSTDQLDFNDFLTLRRTLTFSARYGHLLNNGVSSVVSYPDFMLTDLDRIRKLLEGNIPATLTELRIVFADLKSVVEELKGTAESLARRINALNVYRKIKDFVYDGSDFSDMDLSDEVRVIARQFQKEPNIDAACRIDEGQYRVKIKNNPGFFIELVRILFDNAKNALNKKEKRIEISLKGTSTGIVLEVKDNGRGIHVNELPLIFLPGYMPETDPRFIEGYGMGLTAAFVMVKYMGGRIIVRSKPGVGSTFSVHIPFSEKLQILLDPAS